MATAAMVGRLLLALCFVLGLMWAVGRWARGRGGARRGAAALSILARQQLSRNSAIAVVKVLDQAIIIGVTDGQVSKLGEADLAQFEAQSGAESRSTLRLVSSGKTASARLLGPGPTIEANDLALPAAVGGRSPLAGSALSLGTWRQAVNLLRERTVRRG